MTTPTDHHQHLEAIAEKIVKELLEYDNMDFNDEEKQHHDRRVTFVKDALTEATQPLVEELEKVGNFYHKWAIAMGQPLASSEPPETWIAGHIQKLQSQLADLQNKYDVALGNWHGEEQHAADLKQKLAEAQKNYNELIMAVASKFEGESRHATALRYINEREMGDSDSTDSAMEPERKGK